MKTAEQWMRQLCDDHDYVSTDDLKAVQLDALESAATLLTANADSPTRGFEAVHKLIVELKGK